MKKMAEMFDFRISEHYLPFVSPKIFDNTSKYTACPEPPYMLMLLKTDLFGQPLFELIAVMWEKPRPFTFCSFLFPQLIIIYEMYKS